MFERLLLWGHLSLCLLRVLHAVVPVIINFAVSVLAQLKNLNNHSIELGFKQVNIE